MLLLIRKGRIHIGLNGFGAFLKGFGAVFSSFGACFRHVG
jgi:hypothetical protein